jgi:arylsulfatase
LTVDLERAEGTENGVLMALGGNTSGLSFYLKDNRLIFDYNIFSNHYKVVSEIEVPAGRSTVGVRFERIDRKGKATLSINGQPSGTIDYPMVMRMISALGMDIGRDGLAPVTDDYEGGFAFTGKINRLVFDVPKRISRKAEQEHLETQARTEMGRQ